MITVTVCTSGLIMAAVCTSGLIMAAVCGTGGAGGNGSDDGAGGKDSSV